MTLTSENAWPIETDNQVEALARECDWDNRKYMTPKDYAIWCERMRKFARLAAPSAPADEPECEFGVPEPKFRVGQLVEKTSGYKWPGVVVSRFLTQSLQIRYVVECTVPEVAGALHIYSEQQLVALGGKP